MISLTLFLKDYVSLIPTSVWSSDYILPHELCFMKNNACLQNVKFQTPQDSIVVEPSNDNPANPLTNSVYAVSEVYFFTIMCCKYVIFKMLWCFRLFVSSAYW